MFKGTAQAEQFHTRSGSESTKGSRKGFALLGGGEDPAAHLTAREKWENERRVLVAQMEVVRHELGVAKTDVKRLFGTGDPYFKARDKVTANIKLIGEISAQLGELKKKNKCNPTDLRAAFMDVCRERLTKAQFTLFMDEATKRANAAATEGMQ